MLSTRAGVKNFGLFQTEFLVEIRTFIFMNIINELDEVFSLNKELCLKLTLNLKKLICLYNPYQVMIKIFNYKEENKIKDELKKN